MYSAIENQAIINKGCCALLLDSDSMASALLKNYLEKCYFRIEVLADIDILGQTITATQPDIIIISGAFPTIDNLSLSREIRRTYLGPLLLLDQDSSEQVQIAAFVSGVDDYLVKPVSPTMIKVRAESLVRRAQLTQDNDHSRERQVGNLALDIQGHRCFIAGDPIKLSSFEFRLLDLLIASQGRVQTRANMYRVLLNRTYNGVERTIDVRMAKLREKLNNSGFKYASIETVWGQGYVLNESQQLTQLAS
ncbi:response regulator transcription factor [Colwellia sp. MEBiC06753]